MTFHDADQLPLGIPVRNFAFLSVESVRSIQKWPLAVEAHGNMGLVTKVE